MESLEDSNCPSMSDSFSLYERYMRSFNVREHFDDRHSEQSLSSSSRDYDSSNSGGNIDLTVAIPATLDKHEIQVSEPACDSLQLIYGNIEKDSNSGSLKEQSQGFLVTSSVGTSTGQCLSDKSDLVEPRVFSEESKSECEKPVFITSIMENSNNAVDSVPMFRDVIHENVFKLPISELSFNGTIKHVQKLKPIVDPLTALSTAKSVLNYDDQIESNNEIEIRTVCEKTNQELSDEKSSSSSGNEKTESGDSQYQDKVDNNEGIEGNSKWNSEQSYSSLEASFDSGVRSPDMFSDGEGSDIEAEPEQFWTFLKDVEIYEKKRVRRIQETLQGILPPPSVTTLKTDVTQMLKKYYCFLPAFNGEVLNIEENSMTPTKKVSFVQIPDACHPIQETVDSISRSSIEIEKISRSSSRNASKCEDGNSSLHDKSIELKLGSETEAKESCWPDLLKCRYHDVYYNLTSNSEKYEALLQKYGERFVGSETDTSVNIYSGGMQSPSSASKRKALRLKLAQAKSPGRRLSHLARRRQAFCSAATISEKAQSSTSKMVLIDKNYFPHRKLVNSSERKSPRTKRTPGKKTPGRKTPGKKTPAKTPKTGGSSKKKAMRRLIMDENSKSQPNRETLKRALFISPENRKAVPSVSSMSVPNQNMKSRRSLFGSPVRESETKSMDGTQSDHFLKRKRDPFDDGDNNRSKLAKSLSFGGDIGTAKAVAFNRRASEMLSTRNSAELNETHKKKLLWAVSEALRAHGWRMSSPGFREKASALARLTRKLLTLPPHAARLAAPKLSTSDTLFKLARQYVFAIIQGRTVEECFQDEQIKLANETTKLSGYISATAYQQLKTKTHTLTSQVKENCTEVAPVQEPKSASKNILQDKLVNIDSNSSNSVSLFDKVACRSNSMPSFEEAAKMRARRQISFDNVDFPKR